MAADLVEGASVIVAHADGVIELQDSQRKQCREDHPCQAKVERPEADPSRLIGPVFFRNDIAQAEERKADCIIPYTPIIDAWPWFAVNAVPIS